MFVRCRRCSSHGCDKKYHFLLSMHPAKIFTPLDFNFVLQKAIKFPSLNDALVKKIKSHGCIHESVKKVIKILIFVHQSILRSVPSHNLCNFLTFLM